ncbi:MAG TPA: RNA-binding domain-containing protein [Longimicrobium sp.]|jgi:hypothetical protein
MYDPTNPAAIEAWTLDDLHGLPSEESEIFEYKSGSTPFAHLAEKLERAASAFWNSGGGLFVVGVGDRGRPDVGIPVKVGKQSLRDWVDARLHRVVPPGRYAVRVIEDGRRGGSERTVGTGILLVAFGESRLGPHMAPDHKYYFRAGAHTVPAAHFIIEAIRANRAAPIAAHLTCLLRMRPRERSTGWAVDLHLVATNEVPAIDVTIEVHPVGGRELGFNPSGFPKRVPLVDRQYPFVVPLGTFDSMYNAAFLAVVTWTSPTSGGQSFTAGYTVDANQQLGPAM